AFRSQLDPQFGFVAILMLKTTVLVPAARIEGRLATMPHLNRSADGHLVQHHQFKKSARPKGNRNLCQAARTTQYCFFLVNIHDTSGNEYGRKSASPRALHGPRECLNAVG